LVAAKVARTDPLRRVAAVCSWQLAPRPDAQGDVAIYTSEPATDDLSAVSAALAHRIGHRILREAGVE
jgi:hypothetical protein